MNAVLNAIVALDLAKHNLETLIARGWDTKADHDEVRWLELELARLNK